MPDQDLSSALAGNLQPPGISGAAAPAVTPAPTPPAAPPMPPAGTRAPIPGVPVVDPTRAPLPGAYQQWVAGHPVEHQAAAVEKAYAALAGAITPGAPAPSAPPQVTVPPPAGASPPPAVTEEKKPPKRGRPTKSQTLTLLEKCAAANMEPERARQYLAMLQETL